MKVVICVHSLTGGGAERVASLWIRGFSQRGYDVSVILANRNSQLTYSIPSNIPIYYLGFNCRIDIITSICNKLFFDFKLNKALKQIKPQLAIGVMYNWGSKLLRYKQKYGFKIIHTEHNAFERPKDSPLSSMDTFLKFEVNKHMDAVTVLTHADKTFIGKRLQNVFVLPNPLSLEPLTKICNKKKIILAVGRLDAWYVKGFDLLIKAWSSIQKDAIGWKLRIVGHSSTGNGLIFLKSLCKNLQVEDSVEFIDYQINIQPHYSEASVFVLSSRYEGFGMVLIEAMSQGCACIACDFGGRQREIIRNDTEGIICHTNDVVGLSTSLLAYINNEKSLENIQKQSIERSKEFNLDRIMDVWEKILISIKI